MNNDNHEVDIENVTTVSCEFEYPIECEVDDNTISGAVNEFIQKFAITLITHKDPRVLLCSLLYSCNYDVGILLNCENTETEIAKCLGMSKQNFSNQVKAVCNQYNIEHTNTGKIDTSEYKKSNFKKI